MWVAKFEVLDWEWLQGDVVTVHYHLDIDIVVAFAWVESAGNAFVGIVDYPPVGAVGKVVGNGDHIIEAAIVGGDGVENLIIIYIGLVYYFTL